MGFQVFRILVIGKKIMVSIPTFTYLKWNKCVSSNNPPIYKCLPKEYSMFHACQQSSTWAVITIRTTTPVHLEYLPSYVFSSFLLITKVFSLPGLLDLCHFPWDVGLKSSFFLSLSSKNWAFTICICLMAWHNWIPWVPIFIYVARLSFLLFDVARICHEMLSGTLHKNCESTSLPPLINFCV